MSIIRILFLAANPQDTTPLQLSEELRTIEQRIRASEYREQFDLVQTWAVRESDLAESLLRYRPHIVHFSGHGDSKGRIILESDLKKTKLISAKAISDLFRTLSDNIRCVVLNACYSQVQAKAISQHIDIVIGMPGAIDDLSNIAFAGGFYRGLGWGRDIFTSFQLGCNEIDLNNLNKTNRPRLLSRNGVDPAKLYLLIPETLGPKPNTISVTNSDLSKNTSYTSTLISEKTLSASKFARYADILAREEELKKIDSLFMADHFTALAIIAPSGYGKTVLARKYIAEKVPDVTEAYIDATTILTTKLLAEHLANIFPEQAWRSLVDLGGRQLAELAEQDIKRFIIKIMIAVKCCLVVDHAEVWFESETIISMNREIHATIGSLLRSTNWPTCILTTTRPPTNHVPYHIRTLYIGPLLEELGTILLSRNIVAPIDLLHKLVRRCQGHPYTLDLLSKCMGGNYMSQEGISYLLQFIDSLPVEIYSIFRDEISKLTSPQLTLLLAIAALKMPMPTMWVDKDLAEFLQSRGLILHEIEIESGKRGWVVHPLVRETISISFSSPLIIHTALRETLSKAVQLDYIRASLPFARSTLALGFFADTLSITNIYWRVWAESTGIDDGLRFVRVLAQSPEVSALERDDLLFKVSVLHLYKGDYQNLISAQNYHIEIQKNLNGDKSRYPLMMACLAEEMEVTRRLAGIQEASNHYNTLTSECGMIMQWFDKSEIEMYYRGITFFLLGHFARYTNAFSLAIEYYRQATSLFVRQTSITAKYEILHSVYGTCNCLLKIGRPQEALDQLIEYESNTLVIQSYFLKGLYLYLMSICYLSLNDLAKAQLVLSAAINRFKSFQSFGYWARAQCLSGWIDLLEGRYDDGYKKFSELLELSGLSKDLWAKASCGMGACLLVSRHRSWIPHWIGGLKKLVELQDLLSSYSIIKATQVLQNSSEIFALSEIWNLQVDFGIIDEINKHIKFQKISTSICEIKNLLNLIEDLYPTLKETPYALRGLG